MWLEFNFTYNDGDVIIENFIENDRVYRKNKI